ncbi:MAG: hypothetical protein ACI9TV_002969 [Sulfurimonas sp.]|jgi:hypothetical protein|uniref:DUF4214 domain-containing protein n=1 Tax=Sulfurimonas sp. TaxID=2022749 RepID=UPI0039E6D3AA
MNKLKTSFIILTLLFAITLQAREVSLENKISSLYISFFNRAADKEGLDYWNIAGANAETAGGNALSVLKDLSAGFAGHPTFTTTYGGMGNEEFVQAIYKNSLGKAGDTEGVAYWRGLLDSGKSRSDMIAEFMDLSLTLDLTPEKFPNLSAEDLAAAQERQDLISNKVNVAVHFTNTLGTRTNVIEDNPDLITSNPSYLASIEVLSEVGIDPTTVSDARGKIDIIADSEDAISSININWASLAISNIQLGTRYINLSPTDTQVLINPYPIFKFERNAISTSSTISCANSTATLNDVKLKVIKIDAQNVNAVVALEQIIQVPNECNFEINFPTLTLEENVGYAWYVSDPDDIEDENTTWNSFIYSTQSIGEGDIDPHSCEKNMVQDQSFLQDNSPWETASVPQFTSILPAIILANGDEDNGAGHLQTPNDVLFQTLAYPMEQGKYYQLKFSLKHEGKTDFQIKALAFNGTLDSLQPDLNTSIIAVTGTMTNQNNWVKVTLPAWQANSDFSNLAIAIFNENNETISALIDRVCIAEASYDGCGEEVDVTIDVPSGFDMNNSDPVITITRYEAGATSDLYPNYDTSTSNWYADVNNTDLECSSIGGGEELTSEEQAELDYILSQEEGLDDDYALIDSMELNNTSPDINETGLPLVTTTAGDKTCGDRIVDLSKPFSGRDIVYVHGLQQAVLNGYKHHPPTFTGRWPNDAADFYEGGEYHNATKGYWNNHIRHVLGGDETDPTNSYLIVTWSTNQHLYPAINAILKQVQDARDGNNAGVVFSKEGRNKGQCFGDNGIVFVSHSTGGQIISTMFGLLELNKNNLASPFHIDSSLYDLMDAQVAFDAAFRGSPIATAGLVTNSISVLTHLMGDGIRKLFNDDVLSGASTFVPRDTIMADLGLESYRSHYRSIMEEGTKPTLMLAGTLTGAPTDMSRTAAEVLIRGYNDGVLSSWSQTNHMTKRPKYWVKNKWLLKDLHAERAKKMSMYRKGKIFFNPLKFRYFVTPYLSPSGMIQYNSVQSVADDRAYLKNHYPIIQAPANHFGNVDEIHLNGNSYYQPYEYFENNWEESSVVHDASLYTRGLLSTEFATLPYIEIAKETWGLHWIKTIWVRKEIKIFGKVIRLKVPKFTWHYYEYIKWQRQYELLRNSKDKKGADYMYQYLLRP